LRKAGHIYEGRLPPPKGAPAEDWEDREQTLFRATAFGDDVDRPLMKSDGSYTYFAADIAYHRDKIDRGFTTLIDVWGADHGGYVKRMQAAVRPWRREGRAGRQARASSCGCCAPASPSKCRSGQGTSSRCAKWWMKSARTPSAS
jgi:arginyl-tRNA synthetase